MLMKYMNKQRWVKNNKIKVLKASFMMKAQSLHFYPIQIKIQVLGFARNERYEKIGK